MPPVGRQGIHQDQTTTPGGLLVGPAEHRGAGIVVGHRDLDPITMDLYGELDVAAAEADGVGDELADHEHDITDQVATGIAGCGPPRVELAGNQCARSPD